MEHESQITLSNGVWKTISAFEGMRLHSDCNASASNVPNMQMTHEHFRRALKIRLNASIKSETSDH